MRLIDGDALLTVPNVNWVYEHDETGEYIKYKAVPVEAIEKAPAIDLSPKWISVKDRLPEMFTEVLVYTDRYGGRLEMAHIGVQGWIQNGAILIPTVTHWMPLPEPPKEG